MPNKPTTIPQLPDNFWQKNCDEDVEFAFEQYLNMYHHSFKSAYSPAPRGRGSSAYIFRECIRESQERLEKNNIATLTLGKVRGEVDAMLELGIRLVSGMRVRFDEPAGFDLFMTILRDEFPVEKKAIAASLLCQCKMRDFIFGPPGHKEYTSALNFANLSCQYGLFTHACLNLATICDAGGDNVDKVGPFSVYTHLWTAYHRYREDSGLQRRNARRCALCDKKPQRRSMLKKCAGDCVPDEKPVYCSKKCQRAVSHRHFIFCLAYPSSKIETVESDDEWTTDTDVADWVPSDEEEPPSYF